MTELIDKMKLLRQIAEFGREIPKDQVIGVIARQEAVESDGDLISRAEAIREVASYIWHLPNDVYPHFNGYNVIENIVMDALSTLPSADRPKGKWIVHDIVCREEICLPYECSNCGFRCGSRFNFCPNCGALIPDEPEGEDEESEEEDED